MNKVISIQNSGESFEKSVALFNTALHSDNPFYSNNKFCIFYGHNLPKKDKTVNPHGTIGFYEEFFSTYDWRPIKSNRDLIFLEKNFWKFLEKTVI